jgi:hypothetical protein
MEVEIRKTKAEMERVTEQIKCDEKSGEEKLVELA